MNEKHTPGPWMRTPDDANPGYWFIGTADDPHAVVGLDGEMSEPDARLIAAAPDLLEALEGVEPYLEEDPDYTDDYNERVRAVRAAIAKARGEG